MNGVLHANAVGNGIGVIEAGDIASSGGVRIGSGKISRILSSSNLTGIAISESGSIGNIIVNGHITTSTTGSASIRAKTGIDTITANAITSFISSYTDSSGTGKLGRLTTLTGHLNGPIQALGFNESIPSAGIYVAGDLRGELGFPAAATAITRPIVIEGSIVDDVTYTGRITSDVSLNGPSGYISVGGDCSGDIFFRQSTSSINGTITIGGDLALDGLISSKGGITSSALIQIGGSLQGDIELRFNAAHAGNIIVNAGNASDTWASTGELKRYNSADGAALFTLATGQSQPNQAPYYDRSSTDLGNGSVALVPYRIHNSDCVPVNNSPTAILQSDFAQVDTVGSDPKSVKIDFYGPVRAEHVTRSPVRVEMLLVSEWYDVTHRMDVIVKRPGDAGLSRTVEVKGKPGYYVRASQYRVVPVLLDDNDDRLMCDGLLTGITAPVAASQIYYFNISEDCNKNGVLDSTDILNNTSEDNNSDGRPDECTTWGVCAADMDYSGFVDTDDLDAFVLEFELGSPYADFDGSGFVDTDDYDAFTAAFELGC